MSLELNNKIYNQRANSSFHELLFKIRACFYEKEIIKSIFFLAIGETKSNAYNIDLGGGAGHKTNKIYKHLIGKNGLLELIEPSSGMRKKARQKLKGKNIVISKGSSKNLGNYEYIENIFCNQITHHLNDKEKKELFKNAYKSLSKGGKLFILDTTIPGNKFLRFIFFYLKKYYKKYIGKKNNYYNINTQEYINMLQEAGFEIDLEHTRHFYVLGKLGEIGTKLGILYPFMTQIVAVKK